jgi:hypothetical protein
VTYSAIYRRPDGKVLADWTCYDALRAALLGPASHPIVGERLGYLIRPEVGPPQLIGLPQTAAVDLRR